MAISKPAVETRTRPFNFAAGPAALPEEVLMQVQEELLSFKNGGMSVMEISHRSKEFINVAETAEADLRDLLNIPQNYKVLFLQGGATLQFAAVPLNLSIDTNQTADYIDTGMWSQAAIKEASRYLKVNQVASSKDNNYSKILPRSEWKLSDNAAYFHYCANETVNGVEFADVPEVGDALLVSDMSSNILSKPIDIAKHGVIYAGAQKNIGPAGLTVVIVRDDLIGKARTDTPKITDYKVMADGGSMVNTPPTFGWYLAGLVFKWLKEQGGVEAMAKLSEKKSQLLYKTIDRSGFYKSPVEPDFRSRMNVPFATGNDDLDKKFLKEAQEVGLLNLAGHRAVGGMRASIYNAVSLEAVQTLVDFMNEFARNNG